MEFTIWDCDSVSIQFVNRHCGSIRLSPCLLSLFGLHRAGASFFTMPFRSLWTDANPVSFREIAIFLMFSGFVVVFS